MKHDWYYNKYCLDNNIVPCLDNEVEYVNEIADQMGYYSDDELTPIETPESSPPPVEWKTWDEYSKK